VVELDLYRELQDQGRERRLANLNGQPASEVAELPARGRSRDRAAVLAGVSARTIQNAATVQAADPELFAQVKQGRLAVDKAARQITQLRRDQDLSAPELPEGVFDLLYADPPWRMAGDPASSRAIENHYPTMELEQIAALPIPAADDAVLFLWVVNSLLREGLQVLERWGFEYKNQFVWAKNKIGLGSWTRNQHELLLIGARGKQKPPAPGLRAGSVINAPRRAHSAKPELVYDLLERMYPDACRLEMFKRGIARPGWTVWGNQAELGQEPTDG
jgi:N6-adenosine-specific RNA methylase IME4